MTKQISAESYSAQPSQLRCIGCGVVCEKAEQNFRCLSCGDLLEVLYPGWKTTTPDAAALRARWRQRRASRLPLDESGVWRFRELLPSFDDWQQIITLRVGNTPLYEMPGCARVTGLQHLYA
jgi:threonine synthase